MISMASRFRNALFLVGMAACVSPRAASAATPCATNPESRQLDYWLGDWFVAAPGSTGSSSSNVSLSLDKCLVVENWNDGKDHAGENLFGYSADDRSWRGVFADNRGRVHVFVDGTVAAGAAEFRGPSASSDGKTVLNRVKIVRVTPNTIKQTWERSGDNGATWIMAFHGEYTRRTP
jgi:hypothetical protein